jgi:hypothetical protein
MARIRGELTATADAVDFEDVYVICITDPAAFKATVNATGTEFDTRLSLFTLNGFGLLSNDNDPFSFPTIYSHIQQPATDATGQTIPGPGLYLLAISSKANRPASFGGLIFNDASINGTEISGPDGPGAGQPLAGWTQQDGTVGGKYVIDLEGVKFLDLPCNVECPESAIIDADLGDCSNDGSDVNGGCGMFGEGIQSLGTLSPSGYIAVCGNGGAIRTGLVRRRRHLPLSPRRAVVCERIARHAHARRRAGPGRAASAHARRRLRHARFGVRLARRRVPDRFRSDRVACRRPHGRRRTRVRCDGAVPDELRSLARRGREPQSAVRPERDRELRHPARPSRLRRSRVLRRGVRDRSDLLRRDVGTTRVRTPRSPSASTLHTCATAAPFRTTA